MSAFSIARACQRQGKSLPPFWLMAPGALILCLLLLPLIYIFWQVLSLGPQDGFSEIFRPFIGELLFNTLLLMVTVVLGTLLLAVACAWITERVNIPGLPLWRVLIPLPLAIPGFVGTFSWLSITPRVESMGGAMMILTLAEYPLIYLPVAAALRGLDPAMEDVARSTGHGPWRIFWGTILPQLAPALGSGVILVALHILVEFGSLALLRVETFTTAIYQAYELQFDGPEASVLSLVLIVICLLVLGAEKSVRGNHRYTRSGKGTSRRIQRFDPGLWRWAIMSMLGALTLLTLIVPLGTLVWWLIDSHNRILAQAGEVGTALLGSLGLSLAGAVTTLFPALLLVFLAVRYRTAVARFAERLPFVVHSLPGLVVALALVFFSLHLVPVLYQTTALLLIAYAVMLLPVAQGALRGVIEQYPPGMDEIAASCGLAPHRVFWRVTLPQIMPGIGAALLMVFLQLMKELTATLVLSPPGTQTLSTQLWAESSQMHYGAAAPYAVLLILVSGLPAWFVTRRFYSR